MGFRTLFEPGNGVAVSGGAGFVGDSIPKSGMHGVTAYPLALCILPPSIVLNESKQLFTDGVLRVH